MKKLLSLSLIVTMILLIGCGEGVKENRSPNTDMEKASYIVGHQYGGSLKNQMFDADVAAFLAGFKDGLNEKESLFSNEEVQEIMTKINEEITAKRNEKMKAEGEKNIKEAETFLAENAKKEGVQTTESGLQYKVIEEGKGKSPEKSDRVRVHYEGRLINGDVFDSSYDRGEPAEFPLSGVIPGWTEGLQLMKEGAIYELYVPSELGYGARGAGNKIGPNSTLIFKVELLEIL